jgi:hypothetical protein
MGHRSQVICSQDIGHPVARRVRRLCNNAATGCFVLAVLLFVAPTILRIPPGCARLALPLGFAGFAFAIGGSLATRRSQDRRQGLVWFAVLLFVFMLIHFGKFFR